MKTKTAFLVSFILLVTLLLNGLPAQPTQAASGSIVVNGDFEAGNTGFTSDYGYRSDLVPEGYYYVTDNPIKTHLAFADMGDHTTGSGLMMVVNGAPDTSKVVWQGTVNQDLVVGQSYDFSAWVANVTGVAPAILTFKADGVVIGDLIPSDVGVWQRLYGTFTATSARPVLVLQNAQSAEDGNDFAIDDINIFFEGTQNPPSTNTAPTADAGGSYSGDEGSAIALDGSGSTDDSSITKYEWDCTDDGSYDTSSANPTGNACTYADNGAYTVRLRVTDDGDPALTGEGTATVTVNNVAPTVDAGPGQGVYEGNLFTLSTPTFSDPGTADTHTATIDWGDGSQTAGAVAGGTVSGTHTYAAEGDYTVAVCVTDDDGGQGCDTLMVSVSQVIRFRGYVYNGPMGDTTQSLPDVTLHLYGANEGEALPGSLIATKQSQLSGYFDFYVIAPWFYDTFTLIAENPEGMSPLAAWSEDGTVLDSRSVQWDFPTTTVHENIFTFEIFAVIPTELVTTTVSLPLLNDTWLTWGDPNDNYDAYASLVVRPTGLDNALLKFDRSALPQDATILSAELIVNVSDQTGAAGKQMSVLNSDVYTPIVVTYGNAPATYNPGAGVNIPIAPGPLSFDVAAQVDAWDAPGLISYHWGYLALSANGPTGRISLDSLESSPGTPATLTVTYTIVP